MHELHSVVKMFVKLKKESYDLKKKHKKYSFFEKIAKVFVLFCKYSAALRRLHMEHVRRSYSVHNVHIFLKRHFKQQNR